MIAELIDGLMHGLIDGLIDGLGDGLIDGGIDGSKSEVRSAERKGWGINEEEDWKKWRELDEEPGISGRSIFGKVWRF